VSDTEEEINLTDEDIAEIQADPEAYLLAHLSDDPQNDDAIFFAASMVVGYQMTAQGVDPERVAEFLSGCELEVTIDAEGLKITFNNEEEPHGSD